MGYDIKIGDKNKIPAGTVVFSEKEPVNTICIVTSGSLVARNESCKVKLPTGSFFGITDSVSGRYLCDYATAEDSTVYAFPVNSLDGLRDLLTKNGKDYNGLVINSLATFFGELVKIDDCFSSISSTIYNCIKTNYPAYVKACKNGGMAVNELEMAAQAAPFERKELVTEAEKAYFLELTMIPQPVVKAFFADTIEMPMTLITNATDAISRMMAMVSNAGRYVSEYAKELYNAGDRNILCQAVRLCKDLEKSGRPDKSLTLVCEDVYQTFVKADKVCQAYMGHPDYVDNERLEKVFKSLGDDIDLDNISSDNQAADEDLYRSLKNSLQTILKFSQADDETNAKMEEAINKFVDSKERLAGGDAENIVRKEITKHFYKLYKAAFLESLKAARIPKPVELFLNFGFVDERLLSKAECIELCRLNVQTSQNYICNTFTYPEWLKLIYSGKREPSKNEFDMEYTETLRELLKRHEIDDAEFKKRALDPMARLDFEITNVFRYTERLVNGTISTFVPVLCSEQLMGSVLKSAITKDRIGQLIEKYRELDFTVFYRELTFMDAQKGIEKELVMVEVGPDIILYPCFGTNASMWQEISSKKRDWPGRFLFPILAEGSIDDLVIRNFGRFHWELCRTMMGTAWNNIQFKSLTSEYSDYLQYYRKNHDLTDDKKEKVKNQIIKAKNSSREVFVQDYEMWVKFESQGGMKLNKPSRDILALYCPFKKEVRAALAQQPAFTEPIERYTRETAKKVKELSNHYRSIEKKVELPETLTNTLKFYKEM